MNAGAKNELSWLALAYVCGELDAGAAARFEERLEHDQASREAVAQAVELAAAVARLPEGFATTPGPIRRRPRFGPPRWAAAAAAVVLVALAAAAWRLLPQDPGTSRRSPAPSRSLALAWSGVHGEDDDTDTLLQWLDTPAPAADGHFVAALDASEAAESGVPDWMLEVAALNGGAAADQPSRKEN